MLNSRTSVVYDTSLKEIKDDIKELQNTVYCGSVNNTDCFAGLTCTDWKNYICEHGGGGSSDHFECDCNYVGVSNNCSYVCSERDTGSYTACSEVITCMEAVDINSSTSVNTCSYIHVGSVESQYGLRLGSSYVGNSSSIGLYRGNLTTCSSAYTSINAKCQISLEVCYNSAERSLLCLACRNVMLSGPDICIRNNCGTSEVHVGSSTYITSKRNDDQCAECDTSSTIRVDNSSCKITLIFGSRACPSKYCWVFCGTDGCLYKNGVAVL